MWWAEVWWWEEKHETVDCFYSSFFSLSSPPVQSATISLGHRWPLDTHNIEKGNLALLKWFQRSDLRKKCQVFLNANILSMNGSRNKTFAPLSSFNDSILSPVEVIQMSAGVQLSSCCSAALNCADWLKPTRMEPFITPGAMRDLGTREPPERLVCGFICQAAERRRGHGHKWGFKRSLLWHHLSCWEHSVSCRRAAEGPKGKEKYSRRQDSGCVAAQLLYSYQVLVVVFHSSNYSFTIFLLNLVH